MELSDYVALGALGVSFISLVLSYLTYRHSKRSLDIKNSEYAKSQFSMCYDILNRFYFYDKDVKFCFFAISYFNNSSSKISFVDFKLEAFYMKGKIEVKSVLNPVIKSLNFDEIKSLNILSTPITISENSSVSGYVVFELKDIQYSRFNLVGETHDLNRVVASANFLMSKNVF